MIEFKVTVGSEIVLEKNAVPENILAEIREALKMVNPQRETAKREQLWNWQDLDEHIQLFSEDNDYLYIPRGFLNQLEEGIKFYGGNLKLLDLRVRNPKSESVHYATINVRDYQESAIQHILSNEQGVWESPPGSGKTVAILEAIRRSNQKSLIIVDKTNIAEQWRHRAKYFLDTDIGLVGDNEWDIRDITVALQQSLWAKRDELERTFWFNQWGFVCLDECHHLPANTFSDILARFPARYRIGVSGTPYKQPGQDDLIWSTLGPRFHVTDKQTLRAGGWLVKPEVVIHETGFKAYFWPTHKCDPKKGCNYLYCDRSKTKKRHQNNYSEIMTKLVSDENRNLWIARIVAKEVSAGHCVLVLSKRLKHLDELKKIVGRINGRTDNLFAFTGRETTNRRMEIQERADVGSCALFSTIADEALDIPRISRIHLAWPVRNTGTIQQQIGRGERPHPDKKDVVINDYWDNVGPLTSQLLQRIHDVYIPQQLTIHGAENLLL